jgi:hypothetical protein
LLVWGACALLPLAPLTSEAQDPPVAAPGLTVSTGELQQWAARRFPMRQEVPGFLTFALQAPALRMLPALNRLAAEMPIEASGPALHIPRAGQFEVECGLRYEASDHTIRAHQPTVTTLQLQGLRSGAAELLGHYGTVLAEQALQDLVLHRLSNLDLARIDRLGMQPGTITVTEGGVAMGLTLKPL